MSLRVRVLGLILLVWLPACSQADDKQNNHSEPNRFDFQVRDDIFAGFNGDKEALQRGIERCNQTLEKNPKHAEALVCRGAARVFLAGELFQAQKQAEGFMMWTSGLKDMEDAVKLEPDNVGVRVPRAAVFSQASRNAPPPMSKPLKEIFLTGYQTVYEKQKEHLAQLGTHPRGELLMGLADAYRLQGDLENSTRFLKKVLADMPETKYAKRAEEWLAAKPDAKLIHNCIGCHKK